MESVKQISLRVLSLVLAVLLIAGSVPQGVRAEGSAEAAIAEMESAAQVLAQTDKEDTKTRNAAIGKINAAAKNLVEAVNAEKKRVTDAANAEKDPEKRKALLEAGAKQFSTWAEKAGKLSLAFGKAGVDFPGFGTFAGDLRDQSTSFAEEAGAKPTVNEEGKGKIADWERENGPTNPELEKKEESNKPTDSNRDSRIDDPTQEESNERFKVPNDLGLNADGSHDYTIMKKTLDFTAWHMIFNNWTGWKLTDQQKGIAVDPKTGEVVRKAPEAKYDLIVEAPYDPLSDAYKNEGKKEPVTLVFSGFGFGSKQAHPEAYKGKQNIKEVDVSKYFRSGQLYVDRNDKTRGYIPNVEARSMYLIPAGSKITMVDYTEPGLPGKKIAGRDWQASIFSLSNQERAMTGEFFTDRFKSLLEGSSYAGGNKGGPIPPIQTFTVPEDTEDGSMVQTFFNVWDDQYLTDKQTGEKITNWLNQDVDTNYIGFGNLGKEADHFGINAWPFEMYKLDIHSAYESLDTLEYDISVLGALDPEKENPKKPDKPKDSPSVVKVPMDKKELDLEVTVSHKDEDVDKLDDKGKKPKEPKARDYRIKVPKKPAEEKKIQDITVDVTHETPGGEKGKNVITLPGGVKPGEKKKIRPKSIPAPDPGKRTLICASTDGKTYGVPTEDLTEKEKAKRCIYVEKEAPADLAVDREKSRVGRGDGLFEKNKPLNANFVVSHVEGDQKVGQNPPVKVRITAKDENGRVLQDKTVSQSKLLSKGESVNLPTVQVTPTGSTVNVCATIDPQMAKAGANVANKNDTACFTLYAKDDSRNYSVADLIVDPNAIVLKDGENGKPNQRLNTTFYVTNDSTPGEDALDSRVHYRISVNGKTVKDGYTFVEPGNVKPEKLDVRGNLQPGANKVRVEVNPEHNPKESGKNPYADNVKEFKVYVYSFEGGCKNLPIHPNRRNDFTSEIRYSISFDYDYDVKRCVSKEVGGGGGWVPGLPAWAQPNPSRTVEECSTETYTGSDYVPTSKEVGFTETLDVLPQFRSKYTYDLGKVPQENRREDSQQGWANFPSRAPIKNGYGFEIRYITDYVLKTQNGKSLAEQLPNAEIKGLVRNKAQQIARYRSNVRNIRNIRVSLATSANVQAKSEVYLMVPNVANNNPYCLRMDHYRQGIRGSYAGGYLQEQHEYRLPPTSKRTENGTRRVIYTGKKEGGHVGHIGDLSLTMKPIGGVTLGKRSGKKQPLQEDRKTAPLHLHYDNDITTHILR